MGRSLRNRTLRDRLCFALGVATGGVLLVFALWYLDALSGIVDPALVAYATALFLATSVGSARAYLRHHQPLSAGRASTSAIRGLVDELAARTGIARPRLAMDDSTLGRAYANVAAMEMGPRSETILVTEQLVADLEAGRFAAMSLRGVVLHELGHLAHNHSYLRLWTGVGERLVRIAAVAALVSVALFESSRDALAADPGVGVLIAVGPLAVASVVGILSRAQETQADAFAVQHAAGRELIAFLHWMSTDLGPVLSLSSSGVPDDPAARQEIREGLLRLIAEAETAGDRERAEFVRSALVTLDERVLETRPDLPPATRALLTLRRFGRTLLLAWLGVTRWNRTHPSIGQRLERIAAELGATASGEHGRQPAGQLP